MKRIKAVIPLLLTTILAIIYVPVRKVLLQYDAVHYTMNKVIVIQVLYPIIFGALWGYAAWIKEKNALICFLFSIANILIAVVMYKYTLLPSIYTEILAASFGVWGIRLVRK